jgi:hypothetical protein
VNVAGDLVVVAEEFEEVVVDGTTIMDVDEEA